MTDTPTVADSKGEPDLSGRRLGDYQLIRRLARGGMADVYLAEQQSLRRQVAFKVLRRNLAGDETYVRRFHNEAQAAASLVHANIVQIYEVGCIDGVHFIAQEYVRGQNLKQLVIRRGPLKVRMAINVMRQVAAALHRASSRGIIHRDIKPENIMLASTGEVKVADFGLARVAGDEGLNLTQVGLTLGTPLYMSPEQVEGRPVDPRSDLYSFGVTCYEMLAGQPPFHGDTALSVAVQHLKSEPPRLEDLRQDLPGALCRIVHRMLAKKPAQRYSDAGELLRELRAVPVEGADLDWEADSQQADLAETLNATDARTAATQHLATVMAAESRSLRPGKRRLGWGLVFVLAIIGGVATAWARRPPFLLNTQGIALTKVPEKKTAQEQFNYAMSVHTERAYLAVGKYFDSGRTDDKIYVNKARLHLAYLYQENGRENEALPILSDLAAENSDRLVQARALVALINYHFPRNEMAEVQRRLVVLQQTLAEMGDLPMQQMDLIQSLPPSVRSNLELTPPRGKR